MSEDWPDGLKPVPTPEDPGWAEAHEKAIRDSVQLAVNRPVQMFTGRAVDIVNMHRGLANAAGMRIATIVDTFSNHVDLDCACRTEPYSREHCDVCLQVLAGMLVAAWLRSGDDDDDDDHAKAPTPAPSTSQPA